MKLLVAVASALILMVTLVGCGGTSTTSSDTTFAAPVKFTTTDVSGKYLYSTSPISSTSPGYTTYLLDPSGTASWDSTPGRRGTPVLDKTGTWSIATDGTLVFTESGTGSTTSFNRLQATDTYWVVADQNKKIIRFYVGSTPAEARTPAEQYVASLDPAHLKMGGSIQGTAFPGTVSTARLLAGSPTGVAGFADYSSGSNPGGSVKFNHSVGVTTDGTYLYVADYVNNNIRRVDRTTGATQTIAGSVAGAQGLSDAATGTDARFYRPSDITVTPDGAALYVTDSANNAIRKIGLTAPYPVTTIAGSTAGLAGAVDRAGTDARFNSPNGITTDGTNLYVSDSNNHAIRRIALFAGGGAVQYAVATLAGSAGNNGATDAVGMGARFNFPARLTTDGSNIYVADYGNRIIRKIVIATAQVTTLAGVAGSISSVDTAPGVKATFTQPNGITTDGSAVYVTDGFPANIIRRVATDGTVTTMAGTYNTSGFSELPPISFKAPAGITSDGSSLFVSDSANNMIRKLQ